MYYVSKWKSWLEESDRWSLRRIDLTEGKGGDHCVRHCCAVPVWKSPSIVGTAPEVVLWNVPLPSRRVLP